MLYIISSEVSNTTVWCRWPKPEGTPETSFYWRNGFFWVNLALFGLVFLLELAPMTTFIRVRAAQRRGTPLPQFSIEAYRRINTAEIVLVVTIVFVATFMARGAWLF